MLTAVPDTANLTATTQMQLSKLGVGLLIASADEVKETMPPQDLALSLELPDISQASKRLRKVLGPVYEQFERNQWREGFEEACVALESGAREYLWKTLQSGRTVVLRANGSTKPLKKQRVYSMTMGALAVDFQRLQQQSHADSVIAATLDAVNKDRIRVAHKKRAATAERALRLNVGQQMWRIVGALKEIYKD